MELAPCWEGSSKGKASTPVEMPRIRASGIQKGMWPFTCRGFSYEGGVQIRKPHVCCGCGSLCSLAVSPNSGGGSIV